MSGERKMSMFGDVVMGLAASRGYRKIRALAVLVSAEAGEEVSARRLSSWLHGDHAPPPWFGEALVRVLDLDDAETKRLAWANLLWVRRYSERAKAS